MNLPCAVLHEIIVTGILLLIGFMIAAAVLCMGGHWVHAWIFGCLPAMIFWLAGADFTCYGDNT